MSYNKNEKNHNNVPNKIKVHRPKLLALVVALMGIVISLHFKNKVHQYNFDDVIRFQDSCAKDWHTARKILTYTDENYQVYQTDTIDCNMILSTLDNHGNYNCAITNENGEYYLLLHGNTYIPEGLVMKWIVHADISYDGEKQAVVLELAGHDKEYVLPSGAIVNYKQIWSLPVALINEHKKLIFYVNKCDYTFF